MKKILLGISIISAALFAVSDFPHENKEVEKKTAKAVESWFFEQGTPASVTPAGSVLIENGWYSVPMIIEKAGQKFNEIFLSNGEYLAQNLLKISDSKDYGLLAKEKLSKPLDESYYSEKNLIYGEEGAKHRVVIFSNPLCPHCLNYMNTLYEYITKYKNTSIAVYYYPVLLDGLFPSAVKLIEESERAKIALGDKSLDWKLYRELFTNLELYALAEAGKSKEVAVKVFGAFAENPDILKESKEIIDENNLKVNLLGVNGTPLVYVNGVIDLKFQKSFKLHEESIK